MLEHKPTLFTLFTSRVITQMSQAQREVRLDVWCVCEYHFHQESGITEACGSAPVVVHRNNKYVLTHAVLSF